MLGNSLRSGIFTASLLGNSPRINGQMPRAGFLPKQTKLEDIYVLEKEILEFDDLFLKEVWVANSREYFDKVKNYSLNSLLREIDNSKKGFASEITEFNQKHRLTKFFGGYALNNGFLDDYKRMYSSFLRFFASDRALQFFTNESSADDSDFLSRKALSFEELKYIDLVEEENQNFYNQFDEVLVKAMMCFYKEYFIPRKSYPEESKEFYTKIRKKALEIKRDYEKLIADKQKQELIKGLDDVVKGKGVKTIFSELSESMKKELKKLRGDLIF
ncbi:MAG: hypothetical protein JW791_01505 [Nanoarchaeota archaeon]|nr:hypothetical protein [Nanoarchaeota archaeon]